MTTDDYAWDNRVDSTKISADSMPQRFALTAPIVATDGSKRILLIDPHPTGTWDTWMFPYASLVLTREELREHGVPAHHEIFRSGSTTLGELSSALADLRDELFDEYRRAIELGINAVMPGLSYGTSGSFYENYSLKYSHTSGVFTAYVFQYSFYNGPLSEVPVPHLWVDPAELLGHENGSTIEGRLVSSNVVDAIPAIISHS